MRTSRRTLRRFHPCADPLEGRAAVSSLLPGFPVKPPGFEFQTDDSDPGSKGAASKSPGRSGVGCLVAATLKTDQVIRVSRAEGPGQRSRAVSAEAGATGGKDSPTGLVPVTLGSQPSVADVPTVKPSVGQAGPQQRSGGGGVNVAAIPVQSTQYQALLQGQDVDQGGTTRLLAMAPAADEAPPPSSGGAEEANPTVVSTGGPNDPSLSVRGGIIGGPVHAVLTAPGFQSILKEVTWTVTGAVDTQIYQNSTGFTSSASTGATHILPGLAIDTYSPFWNTSTGSHTVSASVVYTNGTTGSASITVNVVKPTVNAFNITYGSFGWGPSVPGGRMALTLDGEGMIYSATVSLQVGFGDGAFGFIQIVNAKIENTNAVSMLHTLNTGDVLDNYIPAGTEPTDPGYLLENHTVSVPDGGSGTTPTVQPGRFDDKPAIGPIFGTGDAAKELKVTLKFTTYLVFQASGGIWVTLQKTPTLTLTGDMQWDPSNGWTPKVPPTTTPASPLTGTDSVGFLPWTGYWSDAAQLKNFSPPYGS